MDAEIIQNGINTTLINEGDPSLSDERNLHNILVASPKREEKRSIKLMPPKGLQIAPA